MKNLIILLLLLGVMGCGVSTRGSEASPHPKVKNHTVGKWVNIHEKNPGLVGVRVQQFPDCQYETKRYEGKHPVMIIYVFKNGRAHQLGYEPDGTISSGFWWDAPKDHLIWKNLDRSVVDDKKKKK